LVAEVVRAKAGRWDRLDERLELSTSGKGD
jgi:hypothetical protein